MEKEIILFLDLSTQNTGYSVYHNGTYYTSGTLMEKGKDGKLRSYNMLNAIELLIYNYRPSLIIAEKLPPMQHTGQETSIFLHGGMAFLALRNEITYRAVSTPSHWRKVLGFDQSKEENRTEKMKNQALDYASSLTGKQILDDNEADAICLGAAYYIEVQNIKDAFQEEKQGELLCKTF